MMHLGAETGFRNLSYIVDIIQRSTFYLAPNALFIENRWKARIPIVYTFNLVYSITLLNLLKNRTEKTAGFYVRIGTCWEDPLPAGHLLSFLRRTG